MDTDNVLLMTVFQLSDIVVLFHFHENTYTFMHLKPSKPGV